MQTTYEQIRETLKTGDIILFSGRGRVSRLIQFVTKSPYSHVGIVLNTAAGVLLWESTTLSNLKDIDTGELRPGVQVCYLSERLKSYQGSFAVRPLTHAIGQKGAEALEALRRELKGREYEQSSLELIRAVVDVGADQEENLESLFCSELVAEALQRAGVFESLRGSNEYTPADFATMNKPYFKPLQEFTL